MAEVWIGANRRALLIAWALPVMLALAALLLLGATWNSSARLWGEIGGVVLLVLATLTGVVVTQMLHQPRVAYENGEILLYLEGAEPLRVPIEYVECFFRGQGDGLLRGSDGRDTEVATVIIRIAESAQEWHHREVKAALGMWCEGYITIRGTWCEPITGELLKRLNQRLVEVQRAQKASLQETKS